MQKRTTVVAIVAMAALGSMAMPAQAITTCNVTITPMGSSFRVRSTGASAAVGTWRMQAAGYKVVGTAITDSAATTGKTFSDDRNISKGSSLQGEFRVMLEFVPTAGVDTACHAERTAVWGPLGDFVI